MSNNYITNNNKNNKNYEHHLFTCTEFKLSSNAKIIEPAIKINVYNAKNLELEHNQFVTIYILTCDNINDQFETLKYKFVARMSLDFKLLINTCALYIGETTVIKENIDVNNFKVKVEKIFTNTLPSIIHMRLSMDAAMKRKVEKTLDINQYMLDKLKNKYVNLNATWNFSNVLKISCNSVQNNYENVDDENNMKGGVVLLNSIIDIVSNDSAGTRSLLTDARNHQNQNNLKLFSWKMSFNKNSIAELENWFDTAFSVRNNNNVITYKKTPSTTSFMLSGIPGSGKKQLIKRISKERNVNVWFINMMLISNKQYDGDTSWAIKDTFTKAVKAISNNINNQDKQNGCLIILEDLDLILPKMIKNHFDFDSSSNNPSSADRILAKNEILTIMEEINQFQRNYDGTGMLPLRIGCTVSSISHLDAKLQEKFDINIDMGTSTARDYFNIISYYLNILKNTLLYNDDDNDDNKNQSENRWIEKMVKQCNGFTRSDIKIVFGQMKLICHERKINLNAPSFNIYSLWNEALSIGLASLSSKRKMGVVRQNNIDYSGMEEKDDLPSWQSVGGLEKAKRVLEEHVVWPYLYPEEFQRLNISSSNGVLLYGPPGTGKTLLAKAVAGYSGVAFISASITDIMKGDVGSSEAKVAELFRVARQKSPCVVFLDEIQAIFGNRENSGRLGTSMIAQLMMEMDNLNVKNNGIVVLAATNRIDLMDPSLLRPGRFETVVHVGLPSQSDRESILKLYISNMNVEEDIDLTDMAMRLSKMTSNFTGADLYNLCQCAVVNSMKRAGDLHLEFNSKGNFLITFKDFEEALKSDFT